MTIHGCKGCFGGNSNKACPYVQKDDMARIYPAVKECDVIVLASPLYYWNMSGQLRTAVDCLFALEEGDENLKWNNLGHVLAGGNIISSQTVNNSNDQSANTVFRSAIRRDAQRIEAAVHGGHLAINGGKRF